MKPVLSDPMKSAMKICCLAVVFTAFAVRSAGAEPPSKDYELLYEEAFKGNALNEKDWRYRTGARSGTGFHDSLNRKENVSVSDGALHIAVRQETIDGKPANTGGGIISKHQFGYGYYETLSAPFMTGHGVHSSFWQAGGLPGLNNNIFEIDSYEIDSRSSIACHNLYVHLCPKPYKEVPWVHRANVPLKLNADGSYLSGYEYTPQGVTFYEGGQVVGRADWPDMPAQQVVLLSALNGAGKVDGQPGETTFKYFRYYAKDYPGENLLPNGNFEYNQDKVDANKPIAWQQKGTEGASRIIAGDASRDHYYLRQGLSDRASEVSTRQSLEFIRNGDYQLSAMVRSSGGQEIASLSAADFGGTEVVANVAATSRWTRVTLPPIHVMTHGITVTIRSTSAAGQSFDIDDVQLIKPVPPGSTQPATKPFTLIHDPIWSLATHETIRFDGDGKFYFFDRNVGLGDAITVAFTMNPSRRANTSPIERVPKTGKAGWAVQLTESGQIIFRIGSAAESEAVVADAGYEAGKETRVCCVYDKGDAKIYVNGTLAASRAKIAHQVDDTTAAGRLGCVNNPYEAIGDVIARGEPAGTGIAAKMPRYRNYAGTLQDVRVYNRALAVDEIAGRKGHRE